MTDIADIIKVDLRETSPAGAVMVKRYGPWRCRMLAENLETREEFMVAKKADFCTSGIFLPPPGSTHRA
jgi:c-di-GMP-related signal transduction protein